jgi:hypothetical protein
MMVLALAVKQPNHEQNISPIISQINQVNRLEEILEETAVYKDGEEGLAQAWDVHAKGV